MTAACPLELAARTELVVICLQRQGIADLRVETADLRVETAVLSEETTDLREKTIDLHGETADLREETADLRVETADLLCGLSLSRLALVGPSSWANVKVFHQGTLDQKCWAKNIQPGHENKRTVALRLPLLGQKWAHKETTG